MVGSNTNDVLTQFFTEGTMTIAEVVPTTSPSMDIQISSNLERLLYEILDRDGVEVAARLDAFRSTGRFQLDPEHHAALSSTWSAARFGDDLVKNCIAAEADRSGIVLDPHTAVGVLAGRAARRDPAGPLVALATAHPAKFPDAVEAATGVRPELPDRLADLHDRPERLTRMPNDLVVVQECVEAHRRGR